MSTLVLVLVVVLVLEGSDRILVWQVPNALEGSRFNAYRKT
jgi:hypothetical protein